MRRSFIIISIEKDAYLCDILVRYLYGCENILKISRTAEGFIVDLRYEDSVERRNLVDAILRMDVDNIEIYDVLYEEFHAGMA